MRSYRKTIGYTGSYEELIQTWIVHQFQIIGEAARALPDSVREKYPEVPLTKTLENLYLHPHS